VQLENRERERAAEAARLAGDAGEVATADALTDVGLVVHATPVGMSGTGSDRDLPIAADLFGSDQVVVDLVYAPPETSLLRAAAARGARVANGVGMLVHQAARSFELWTGEPAPIEAMRAAVDGPAGGIRPSRG
jgi:shikimate dehydrogenase